MAAVEFALILPMLIVLWIGGVEVTQALTMDRKVNNLASTVGDLVARWKSLTYSDVDSIFDIAGGVLYPYAAGSADMVLTAVNVDDKGNATVAWSRAKGKRAAYSQGANMNAAIDAKLRTPSSQVIMTEAYYPYRPAVGHVITGPIQLDSKLFFVPRLSSKVQLCTNSSASKVCY